MRVLLLSRPHVPWEDVTLSVGVGGSVVREGLRRCPFTLNCLPDLGSEISTDPFSNDSTTT